MAADTTSSVDRGENDPMRGSWDLSSETWPVEEELGDGGDPTDAFKSHLAELFSEEETYRVGERESLAAVAPPAKKQFDQVEFAGIQENWDDVQNLDARILEVRPKSVKVEVLVNREERRFQDRVFPKDLLQGAVCLNEGNYILIRRFKAKGKIKFTFQDGNRVVEKEAFEDTSRFQDLDDFGFDRDL